MMELLGSHDVPLSTPIVTHSLTSANRTDESINHTLEELFGIQLAQPDLTDAEFDKLIRELLHESPSSTASSSSSEPPHDAQYTSHYWSDIHPDIVAQAYTKTHHLPLHTNTFIVCMIDNFIPKGGFKTMDEKGKCIETLIHQLREYCTLFYISLRPHPHIFTKYIVEMNVVDYTLAFPVMDYLLHHGFSITVCCTRVHVMVRYLDIAARQRFTCERLERIILHKKYHQVTRHLKKFETNSPLIKGDMFIMRLIVTHHFRSEMRNLLDSQLWRINDGKVFAQWLNRYYQ